MTSTPTIRIGTRGSALALWQAEHVAKRLRAAGRAVDIKRITTTGDRILDKRLETVGGKAAFLKEIEEALVAREVDLAVHSLKDVPTALPDGLVLCAFLAREDPRDAVLSREGQTLAGLPRGARVGTTSLRRAALIKELRKDLVIEDLRGNVDSRIRRLREGSFDAILLAMAGLIRLGRESEVAEALNPVQFIPAPGQGVIALECRAGDMAIMEAAAPLHDRSDRPRRRCRARGARRPRRKLQRAHGRLCRGQRAHAAAVGLPRPARRLAHGAGPRRRGRPAGGRPRAGGAAARLGRGPAAVR